MKAWVTHARPFLAAILIGGAVVACDEQLEGGMACPALCPGRPAMVRDTTFFAVEFDTTIPGFPPTGSEVELLLAARGDTLDARAILRFDSLPTTFRHNNSVVDSNIVLVDSAMVKLRVAGSDTLGPAITVELYDVDVNAGEDTSVAQLLPAFTASRLIGSRTFAPESLKDSLRIPIMPEKLLEKIAAEPQFRRLRVGVRITAAASAQIRVFSANNSRGQPPLLYFRPSPDSSVAAVQLGVFSRTPALPVLADDVRDFQLIAQAPPPEPPNVLRIGGLPGKRGYLRFNIPAVILDSSSIVRAQLLLTQRPNPEGADSRDSAAVQTFGVSVGSVLTDFSRILLFLSSGLDSTRAVPADSGVRTFEIITLVRSWKGTKPDRTPRAIALRATTEGIKPWQVDFFSNEAPDTVRPRLRITYVPRPSPGLP